MNSSVSAPSSSRKYSATVRAGERHAQTRSRRLGHLAVDQRGLRLGRIARLDHAGLAHFQPQVVAFAGTLADAGEHGIAAVLLGDVVDEFHDDDGLAHACAAEQADLAALEEGLDQVDDLDTGLEHLGARRLLVEGGSRTVNRHPYLARSIGPSLSTGSPITFITRPSVARPTGTMIGPPRSIAFMPRTMPSVGCMATQRTRPSPRCCCTSRMTSIGAGRRSRRSPRESRCRSEAASLRRTARRRRGRRSE